MEERLEPPTAPAAKNAVICSLRIVDKLFQDQEAGNGKQYESGKNGV